ncbi:MAG: SEC-C domain-containing protein [Candidatus Thiosymbion ectosymbiont of Robbea hypermnestra]|nr:SEC-C domain-containing protein [Candidatus Thiosymbion ectosymbiont of Robbea hypermnestra]
MKKTGRNEKCLCGSGKKYKKCCLRTEDKNKIQPLWTFSP